MSLSISAAATQPASAPAATTPAPAPVAANQPVQTQVPEDTVTLSLSAQVIQLNQQGQQAPQIALILGIPLSAVNSDLGLAASAAG